MRAACEKVSLLFTYRHPSTPDDYQGSLNSALIPGRPDRPRNPRLAVIIRGKPPANGGSAQFPRARWRGGYQNDQERAVAEIITPPRSGCAGAAASYTGPSRFHSIRRKSWSGRPDW